MKKTFEIRAISIEIRVMELSVKRANTWSAMLSAEFKAEQLMKAGKGHTNECTQAVIEYQRLEGEYMLIGKKLKNYPKELVDKYIA
ncbi:hypothetical protein [Peribacillus frigoritolerans]|uniref:Uncharacterized protein n=1 Tax=Peribacillus castrilensis TaxID=2897690 RepID=A0AAW9NL53_9BACI|nr:hypothetical protein [Peribacillus castrilensis]